MARPLDDTITTMGVLIRRAREKKLQAILRRSAREMKAIREKRLLMWKEKGIDAAIETRVSDSFWLIV